MTPTEANVQVFWTAFMSLPHVAQETFFSKAIKSPKFREDLIDLAIAESRKNERTKPFSKVVSFLKANRCK